MKSLFLLAGAITALATTGANAQGVINFSDVAPGSVINTQYQSSFGITFTPQYVNNANNGQVYADNPGLGPNPDPNLNALLGIYSPTFVDFDPTTYAAGAKLTFDVVNEPLGAGQANVPVSIFDGNGLLLNTVLIDEIVGGTYTISGRGATRILFPADADYTNLRPTAVPEPGSIALVMAMSGVSFVALRRRK